MDACDSLRLTFPAWSTQPDDSEASIHGFHVASAQIPMRSLTASRSEMTAVLTAARAAAVSAYAPFSRFRVGAAVIMDDDPERATIPGANVENSAYGLTQCAERTALQSAASRGFRRLRYLALTCLDSPPNAPLSQRMPCGACRQVIREFGDANTLILVDRITPSFAADVFDVERLLPLAFRFTP